MELIFEEKDIEVLDKMVALISIHPGAGFTRKQFIKENIISKDTTILEFAHYAYILDCHCAQMTNDASGDEVYVVRCDKRTANFCKSGGFQSLNKELKKREKESNELVELQRKCLELQNDKMKYEERIRIWKFVSLFLGIIVAVLAIWQFFKF